MVPLAAAALAAMAALLGRVPPSDIGPLPDPTAAEFQKRLILLARPRGFEPLLPP